MAAKLEVEIIGDASSLKRALGAAGRDSSTFGSKLASLGKIAAIGLGAVAAGAVVAGKQMIRLASDAAEVDSKMKVIFGKALPELTDNLDAFAKATGASRFELREQAADMGALLEPLTANKKAAADMSEQFVELAADLGSFNNVPTADALIAIRAGLVGEAEPLRRFGVLLNEAAVKSEAYRSGIAKVGAELTEQQKVQARANLIMQQTSLAQGDAERTAGSMANQMKALKNNVIDMATSLGTLLIPYALKVVEAFNNNWPTIEKVIKAVMTAIITGITAVITAVQYLRGQWEIHRDTVIATWKVVQTAVMQTIAWFKTNVVPPIKAVIDAALLIWRNFGGEIKTVLATVVLIVKTFLQNMLAPFKIFFALLRGDWQAAWDELKATVSRTLGAIVTIVRNLGGSIISAALTIGKGIVTGVLNALAGIGGKVGDKLQAVVVAVGTLAARVFALARQVGENIIRGIAQGFQSLIGWLKGIIESALGFIKNLSPFSSVEEGGAKYIGKPLMKGAGRGVDEGKGELADKTKRAVQEAITASQSLIAAASRMLGSRAVQEIINGVIGVTPSLKAQLRGALTEAMEAGRQAVIEANAGFVAAFGSLGDAALAALDAKFADWKPPALKLLEKMQAEDAKKNIDDAVADAQAALNQAKLEGKEFPPLKLGEIPSAEWLAAEAKINAAQDALDAAVRARIEFNLGLKAAQQQAAHDREMEQRRRHLGEELAEIQKWLAKHPGEWEEAQKKVFRVLAKYGIDYRNWGRKLGEEFAQGLREALDEVKKAAEALAEAAKPPLKGKSPPKEGPLKDIDKWGVGIVKAYAGGITKSIGYVDKALAGMVAGGVHGAPAGAGMGRGVAVAGGGQVVHVHVAGSVVTERELSDVVLRELRRNHGRNGTLGIA